jgi:hypothetical protein
MAVDILDIARARLCVGLGVMEPVVAVPLFAVNIPLA